MSLSRARPPANPAPGSSTAETTADIQSAASVVGKYPDLLVYVVLSTRVITFFPSGLLPPSGFIYRRGSLAPDALVSGLAQLKFGGLPTRQNQKVTARTNLTLWHLTHGWSMYVHSCHFRLLDTSSLLRIRVGPI